MTGSTQHESSTLDEVLASGEGDWVLDPAQSRIEFAVGMLGGLSTVHGVFTDISGRGHLHQDHTVTGELSVEVDSLETGNRRRDTHLRTATFFDAANHPVITMELASATKVAPAGLICRGTAEAAGRRVPIGFEASVQEITADSLTMRAEVDLDRTRFGMTWNPLHAFSRTAHITAVARFTHG